MEHEVFVSYSTKDKPVADAVCATLEAHGIRCWIAPRDILPGMEWSEAIINAITRAPVFVLVFSANSNRSVQVKREVERAVNKGAVIIPFRIEDESPSGSMEYFLSMPHWLDALTPPLDAHLLELSRKVALWLEHEKETPGTTPRQRATDRAEVPPTPGQSTVGHDIAPAIDEAEMDDEFSSSIREHMATLDRCVERLTAEQFSVIRQLRGMRRVRISGCAGSGKTLVAAEKAIRLCSAGVHTLFLCHNPLLADHVRRLTQGTGVEVETFGEWVMSLAEGAVDHTGESWTNLEEPDSATIARAFDKLADFGLYDGVIVDEGQDFREEWWTVVQASLRDPDSDILYIFHDDFQAVLPYRAQYPVQEPCLDLSRNCRNAGKVYELVRHLSARAAPVEDDLRNLGEVCLLTYDHGGERSVITQALRWVSNLGLRESLVALHAGFTPLDDTPLTGTFVLDEELDWQAEVRRKFGHAISIADPAGVWVPAGGQPEVLERLARLSNSPAPSTEDVETVREVARSFSINPEVRRKLLNDPRLRGRMTWVMRDRRLQLWKPRRPQLWASEIITHFEREDWHRGIPEPNVVRLERYSEIDEPNIVPIYRVGDFKGLEADAVLLHLPGPTRISREEIYVGISRARMLLALVVDNQALASLPLPIRAVLSGDPLRRSWR